MCAHDVGRVHRQRPQSAPLQRKPALLRAGDAHAATLTRCTAGNVSNHAVRDECQPGGAERSASVSASMQRGGGKYGSNRENTHSQSAAVQGGGGKPEPTDHTRGRFMKTVSRTPGAGGLGTEGCLTRPQTLKNSSQTATRKPRPLSGSHTRARFFYGEAMGRTQYPEIDITSY